MTEMVEYLPSDLWLELIKEDTSVPEGAQIAGKGETKMI